MKQVAAMLPLCCLLVFHSPDGSGLLVQSDAILAVRPVAKAHGVHVAPGVHSVIYLGGAGSGGFGVVEDAAAVERQIRECR